MEKFTSLGIKIPKFQVGTLKNGIQLQYSGPSYLEFLDLMKRDNPNAYNRLLSEITKEKSPHSEVVRYKDADGNIRNTANVGAGYVSGVDPIGLLVVEGAIMNKPLQWVGKGISIAGKKAIKLASKLNFKINNDLHFAKIGDLLKQNRVFQHEYYKLPDYAIPNSASTKAIEYHLARIEKGFKNIPNVDNKGMKTLNGIPYRSNNSLIEYIDVNENLNKYVTDLYNFLKKRYPNYSDNLIQDAVKEAIKENPAFAPASFGKVFTNKKLLTNIYGFNNIPGIVSHEIDHAIHIPTKPAKGFNIEYLRKSTPSDLDYFIRNNNTDIAARGTLIKDYFGLISPDLELTEDMLKYASLNYIEDTGINNEMSQFFNGITDWKEAAKWLSEMSTVYTGANILNNL